MGVKLSWEGIEYVLNLIEINCFSVLKITDDLSKHSFKPVSNC